MAGQPFRHKSLVLLAIRGVPELVLVHERLTDRSGYSRVMALPEAFSQKSLGDWVLSEQWTSN